MKITVDIPLPISQVGLSLKAALVAGGAVDSTFRELTVDVLYGSVYHFEHDSFPNDFRGSLIFYTGSITTDTLIDNTIGFRSSVAIDGSEVSGTGVGSAEVIP